MRPLTNRLRSTTAVFSCLVPPIPFLPDGFDFGCHFRENFVRVKVCVESSHLINDSPITVMRFVSFGFGVGIRGRSVPLLHAGLLAEVYPRIPDDQARLVRHSTAPS